MRLVIQRAERASVRIDGDEVAAIGPGLVILVGVFREDSPASADALAGRAAALRCFADTDGRMNLSCAQAAGEFLVVSQFTLCADLSRGRRPGFEPAMAPGPARDLYERFVATLARESGRPVRTGRFGADMKVDLVNDGPVTFVMEG